MALKRGAGVCFGNEWVAYDDMMAQAVELQGGERFAARYLRAVEEYNRNLAKNKVGAPATQ